MAEIPGPLDGRHVLLVEDEYIIAIEVERWLREAGATVLGPVPSVFRALDLIADRTPDAAVLDIDLGEDDTVYPLADRLSTLGIPYLFTTGDIRVADEPAYHAKPRLEKPVLDAELVGALLRLLASRA